jgi:hypothetical protein
MFSEYKYPSFPATNKLFPLITGDEVIGELNNIVPGL